MARNLGNTLGYKGDKGHPVYVGASNAAQAWLDGNGGDKAGFVSGEVMRTKHKKGSGSDVNYTKA